jgi:hypothetical protein
LGLTSESRRARWTILAATWALVAALGLLDALATRKYVQLLDDSGTLSAAGLPLQRPAPANYDDALTWTRLALGLSEQPGWQLRWTTIDNAPAGREVHWSSAFAHLISAAGKARRQATGEPLPLATERMLAWFNLPLILAAVIVFSGLIAARFGAGAGMILALGMVGHPSFYLGFAPNYVDHHGLLSAAALGVVLGAVLMGGGWHGPNREEAGLLPPSITAARRGAILSAVSGGLGMWISAASIIPTIAIVGVAAVASAWWIQPREDAQLDGDLWRLWGRVGAAISAVSYLAEYAPQHLGVRLEANHPLYALAWLGGGELIAALLERRAGKSRTPAWRTALATAAVAAAPATIAIWGDRVFMLLDPRESVIHHAIGEFASLAAAARMPDSDGWAGFLPGLLLFAPGLLVLRRRLPDRRVIGFATIVVTLSFGLAAWQIRWWLSTSGPELVLLVAVMAVVAREWRQRARWAAVGVWWRPDSPRTGASRSRTRITT